DRQRTRDSGKKLKCNETLTGSVSKLVEKVKTGRDPDRHAPIVWSRANKRNREFAVKQKMEVTPCLVTVASGLYASAQRGTPWKSGLFSLRNFKNGAGRHWNAPSTASDKKGRGRRP